MTASKEIFLKNNELMNWWISVCHDPKFDQVATFARAEVMELRPTGNQMIGCELMLSTLRSLVDPEAPGFDINDAGVGLDHNLKHERKTEPQDKKQED